MLLSDLLDVPVRAPSGAPLGYVVDVRLVLDGPLDGGLLVQPRVHGLLVSPRTGSSFMGYERTDVRSPAILARWLRWRHRGTFLVHWEHVATATADGVVLADGYRRWSPAFPEGAHRRT
jgi:hypothetical protein